MSCLVESTVQPSEEGVGIITLSFTDEDNNVVVPTSLQWQLADKNGAVINSRTFASGSFSGNTVVLSGNDLALQSVTDEGDRYFTVKGLYTSSAGTNLPLIGELKFTICSLVNIT